MYILSSQSVWSEGILGVMVNSYHKKNNVKQIICNYCFFMQLLVAGVDVAQMLYVTGNFTHAYVSKGPDPIQ